MTIQIAKIENKKIIETNSIVVDSETLPKFLTDAGWIRLETVLIDKGPKDGQVFAGIEEIYKNGTLTKTVTYK